VKKVLEQHVTLSDTQVNKFEKERDGKKICWNYRKGRCYKGHNCPMFHDGDIAATPKTAAQSSEGPNFRNASRGPTDADIKHMIASDVQGWDPFNKIFRNYILHCISAAVAIIDSIIVIFFAKKI